MAKKKGLTEKQKRFCDYYLQSANATESAIKAGYSKKTAPFIGAENLRKPQIQEYLQTRLKKQESSRIATMEEVQEFWAEVMRDGGNKKQDRIKASELIAKSQGAFLDRIQHEGGFILEIESDYGLSQTN